ncbi:MAG TPA: hypothetical protein VF006_18340 [Longimicrobium sp.]
MHQLKPHQQDLLDDVVRQGRVSISQVDGRVLRPLRAAGLVRVSENHVEATEEGLLHARADTHAATTPRLNERQEELLRLVLRLSKAPVEDVDLRVARPLVSRGLITLRGDVVTPTSAGRTYFDKPLPSTPRRRSSRLEHPRAAVIRRVARDLESVIPPGSEVLVGNIMAAATDVIDAFRSHARELDNNQSS